MAGEELGKRTEKSRVMWEGVPERRACFWRVRVWTMEHSWIRQVQVSRWVGLDDGADWMSVPYLKLVIELLETQDP